MLNQPIQSIKFNDSEQGRLDLLEKRLNNFISEIDLASKKLSGLKVESESIKRENIYLTEQNENMKARLISLSEEENRSKEILSENEKNLEKILEENKKITEVQNNNQLILDSSKKELIAEKKKLEIDSELLNQQLIKFAQDNDLFQKKYKELSDVVNKWK